MLNALLAPARSSVVRAIGHNALASRPVRGAVAAGVARRALTNDNAKSSAPPPPSLSSFSDEENILRESVARFARDTIGPHVRDMDEKQQLHPSILKGCFEQGLMGTEVPSEYGGAGMSFTSGCIVIEELAKVDPAVSVIVDIQNTLISTIMMKWGNDEQKRKYLPRLTKDTLGSFCLSEWTSGSDAFAMKTRAVKDGSHYVINGTKAWISNAKEAGLFLVMANASPDKGYKGITAFLLERDTPGLVIGKKEDKCGIRASSTCEVNLNDVRVPASAILGKEGLGYKIAIEALNEGRIGIAAQMLGLSQGAFNMTMPYIIQRQQFGQSIASFQGVQFQYARLACEIEAARLLTYNAARLKDEGKDCRQEAAMAKLMSSETANRVASMCVELCGGMGFTKEFGLEKFYRDAKIGVIYEGTSNLQLATIAKAVVSKHQQ